VGILKIKKNIILYSITVFCTILWVQSCKKTLAKPPSQPQVNRLLDTQEVVKKQDPTTPNVSQQQEFSEWPNYPILDIAIKNLENGDPIDGINRLFLDINKSVPNSLKTNSILVRVKVTETLTHKLNELFSVEITDLKELNQTKADLIESHSNLIFQIIKIREKEAHRILKPI
jgi:hypothetical protein